MPFLRIFSEYFIIPSQDDKFIFKIWVDRMTFHKWPETIRYAMRYSRETLHNLEKCAAMQEAWQLQDLSR